MTIRKYSKLDIYLLLHEYDGCCFLLTKEYFRRAGSFYGDVAAYVDETCKHCIPGTFVHPRFAPGKNILDCKICPKGNRIRINV